MNPVVYNNNVAYVDSKIVVLLLVVLFFYFLKCGSPIKEAFLEIFEDYSDYDEDEEFYDLYEGTGPSHDTAVQAGMGAEDERRFDNPEGYGNDYAHVHASGMHYANKEFLKEIEKFEDGYEEKDSKSTSELIKLQLR